MSSIVEIIILLFITLSGFLSLSQSDELYKTHLAGIIVLLLLCIIILFKSRNRNLGQKKWVSTFYLFLVAYFIVHFQKFIDILVLPNMDDIFGVYNNHEVVLRTAYISLLGFEGLILGYLCFSRKLKSLNYNSHFQQDSLCTISRLRVIAFVQFLAVVLFIFYNGTIYLAGGYSQEMINQMSGSMNAYVVILVDFMTYAAILINAAILNRNQKDLNLVSFLRSFPVLFHVSVIVYLSFVLISGDRGPIITYFLAILYGYLLVSKKNINIFRILVIFFVASLSISIVGIARQDRAVNGSLKGPKSYYNTVMAGESVMPLTDELAHSNRTAIWAVESTPDLYPYRYGFYTLNNLISVIPFSNSILNALGLNLLAYSKYGHSGAFLDWYSQGDIVTAGVGTSTVADIYLDFGPYGVFIVLFILGMILCKTDYILYNVKSSSISLWWQVVGIVLFSNSVYMARSVMLFQLRNVVWLYLVMLLIFKLGKK